MSDFGLLEEKSNLSTTTSAYCAGTYIWIWIEKTIVYKLKKPDSNLQHIYQMTKKEYSGQFWFTGRNSNLSSSTSVFCAGTYIWIWIEKTIAYSNLQNIFQTKKIDYSG